MSSPARRGTALPLTLLVMAGCVHHELRKFPDRPVAWHEHDDEPLATRPKGNPDEFKIAWGFRNAVPRRLDQALAWETTMPAEDVNAADEVPCSTWYCPRNHLRPLSPAAITAGPPGASPPSLPITIKKGKSVGATSGFIAEDARGKKYIVKFDADGWLGLSTGAEAVGGRLAWAAGWNVPGSFVISLHDDEIRISPKATYLRAGYDEEPYTTAILDRVLAGAARNPDGSYRAVAVPFIEGDILGDIELQGRRPGDPNDRIPHERRRSLRALRVVMAWLNVFDHSQLNTIDSLVTDARGRRYVKHFIVDYGAGLGSYTTSSKGPLQGNEAYFAPNKIVRAIVSLGAWQRPWQHDRREYDDDEPFDPAVGWFPAEDWDPETWRPNRQSKSIDQMTDRDGYWGAKVVTSFTDEQIAAAVAAGHYAARSAATITRTLAIRRDKIGRVWLRRMTALERPVVSASGDRLCFQDLAIARGYATAAETAYAWRVTDDGGRVLAKGGAKPKGAASCLVVGKLPGGAAYRVVRVESVHDGKAAKGAAVHLRWRDAERRWVVVGVERDE